MKRARLDSDDEFDSSTQTQTQSQRQPEASASAPLSGINWDEEVHIENYLTKSFFFFFY